MAARRESVRRSGVVDDPAKTPSEPGGRRRPNPSGDLEKPRIREIPVLESRPPEYALDMANTGRFAACTSSAGRFWFGGIEQNGGIRADAKLPCLVENAVERQLDKLGAWRPPPVEPVRERGRHAWPRDPAWRRTGAHRRTAEGRRRATVAACMDGRPGRRALQASRDRAGRSRTRTVRAGSFACGPESRRAHAGGRERDRRAFGATGRIGRDVRSDRHPRSLRSQTPSAIDARTSRDGRRSGRRGCRDAPDLRRPIRRREPESSRARAVGEVQPCSPSDRAVFHIRQWSCGMWLCVRPKGLNASCTAFEKQGTPPTFGLSPTPLAPIG